MKFRPDTSTSERQLVLALAASGHKVALNELSVWRKDGLLPPLASSGVGNGRTYYWREPDILAHARATHDALQKYGRVDMTIVALWLQGFRVPLTQLRRAWAYRSQQRKSLRIKSQTQSRPSAEARDFRAGLSSLLVQTMASMGAAVDCGENPRQAISLLERALMKLGYASASDTNGMASHLWQALTVIAWALEGGDLIREACDEELLKAQRYLRLAMRVLDDCRGPEDRSEITQTMAPNLFLLLLTQIRSGREALLETLATRLTASERREIPAPLYAHN